MKRITMLVLAGVLAVSSAVARADTAPITKAPAAKATSTASSGGAIKVSQQDKMRLCAKQATGKKGAERKAFMKTCLSSKKA